MIARCQICKGITFKKNGDCINCCYEKVKETSDFDQCTMCLEKTFCYNTTREFHKKKATELL